MPEPMWTPSLGELVASRPSVRFSHPERLASPGLASSTSSIASKCDRFGTARPTAVTAAIRLVVPEACEGRQRGVQPEHRVPLDQRGGGHLDGRPGSRVAGVAVRHDQAEHVGTAAQRERDEHVGVGRGLGGRGERRLEERRAEHRGARGRGEAAQEAAAARRAHRVVAAALVGTRLTGVAGAGRGAVGVGHRLVLNGSCGRASRAAARAARTSCDRTRSGRG